MFAMKIMIRFKNGQVGVVMANAIYRIIADGVKCVVLEVGNKYYYSTAHTFQNDKEYHRILDMLWRDTAPVDLAIYGEFNLADGVMTEYILNELSGGK